MNLRYRPFAVMGFGSLAVLLSCVFFNEKLAAVFIAVGIFSIIITVLFKRVRDSVFPFFLSASLLFSGIMFMSVNENNLNYAKSYIGDVAEISGVVTDEPSYSYSRYYYIIDLDSIDGNSVNCKLRLSVPNELGAEPYDKITLNAKIYEIGAEVDDVQLYYQSKGIFLGAYAYNSEDFSVEITKSDKTLFSYKVFLLRKEINSRIIDKLPNENGATIIAMLLGDKTNLSDELNQKFREAGIAPLFAVSGLHLSVWVMGLYSLLSDLGIKKKLNSLIGIAFTLFFMILTGLSPSVCRSGVMMLLLLVGNLFYRKTDSLNSLGFAAFILCSFNPYIVADSGFLMSFSATLGIVTMMPVVNKYILSKIHQSCLGKAVKAFLNIIAVSVTASIGVFPVTVFFVGYFSVLGIVTNLLVTYAATVCMIIGGLIAISYNIGFLSDFFALIAGLLSKYVIWVVRLICKVPVSTISTESFFWKTGVVLCVAVVVFSLTCFKKKLLIKSMTVGLSAVILISSVSSFLYYDNLTQIRLLNVGNGVSAVVFKDNQKIVLSGNADGYYKVNEISDSLNSINRKSADILLLGDVDGAEDSANLDLIKTNKFKKIVVPESSRSLETIIFDSELVESNSINIKTWDNGVIKYYCCDDYSVAHCAFEDTSILFIFSSKKYVEINSKFMDADYLVCNGYIPNCISPEKYKNVILCGDDKTESAVYDYVVSCGGKPLKLYDYKDIRINIRENSDKLFFMEG